MAAAKRPRGLGERGAALWTALGFEADSASGQLALEACRAADRLEDLDAVVRGKGVVELLTFRLQHHFDDENGDRNFVVKVEFSNVLAEARQQQQNLKALLESLGVKGGASASGGKPAPAGPVASPLDELRQRRAAGER